jgi:hypothetical protein
LYSLLAAKESFVGETTHQRQLMHARRRSAVAGPSLSVVAAGRKISRPGVCSGHAPLFAPFVKPTGANVLLDLAVANVGDVLLAPSRYQL